MEKQEEPITIIPEANHEVRELLAMFVQDPELDKNMGVQIMEALLNSSAVFFVHVVRKVGAVGEPPITAEDLALMHMEGGIPIRMILASTKLTPDNLSTTLAERGIYCRQLPFKVLYGFCIERGILAIELDGGLETEVLIGPIGTDRPAKVSLMPKAMGRGLT